MRHQIGKEEGKVRVSNREHFYSSILTGFVFKVWDLISYCVFGRLLDIGKCFILNIEVVKN